MSHGDPRYQDVNTMWPDPAPACTRIEAGRAARMLFLRFGGTQHGSVNMTGPARFTGVRRCWVSLKPYRGLHRGWARLAHDVSHDIFRKRHPGMRPHAGGHATLEREIAAHILTNDWLAGALAPRKRPVLSDTVRIAKLHNLLAKQTTRLKRTQTLVKKTIKRIKYYERKQESRP